MWQLLLLSWVVPAFGALTKEFIESDTENATSRDAEACYTDIVGIGQAISASGGEWASRLDSTIITRLLTAFTTRLPKRRAGFFSALSFREKGDPQFDESSQFPQLDDLAKILAKDGLGGYQECWEIMNQTPETRQRYLAAIRPAVQIFHKDEQHNLMQREKFLKRLRVAAMHLLQVYFEAEQGPDFGGLTLTQHPSQGMKILADKVYKSLEQHWICTCSCQASRSINRREVRLSLTRHRVLASKQASHLKIGSAQLPVKFEVLFPICEDEGAWKITDVEVKSGRSEVLPISSKTHVDTGICQQLTFGNRLLDVHFCIVGDKLFRVKPDLRKKRNEVTIMEPLHQLLGTRSGQSYIANCDPRDQLILCYILANSMLYLYPGFWLSAEWNSSMVYFTRRSNISLSPILTSPYVSTGLQSCEASQKPSADMPGHSHPAVLALGIILLEIASGIRFKRSMDPVPWLRCIEDTKRARRHLERLERREGRNRNSRVSSNLCRAIRACLELLPPPDFPVAELSSEGPIRYFILVCIVHPLALELENGYHIDLTCLNETLLPDREVESCDDNDTLGSVSGRSDASVEEEYHSHFNNVAASPPTKTTSRPVCSNTVESYAKQWEVCLYRDGDENVDKNKVKSALTWFENHENVLLSISKIRNMEKSNADRVKIALLDSGIELSQGNIDMYNNSQPSIQYRSWVDQDTAWKDQVGHGTHLAVLLRKIAPDAIVHVGRVFKKKPTHHSASIIAQAIRDVVNDWQVHMVVISFGFGEEHQDIYEVIRYAASRGVLIFAAASNDGKNRPDGVTWPARDSNVICVHSGDGYGNPSAFTPDPLDSMRIMVLGEYVTSAWPPHLESVDDHQMMSGTSCAAPIGAGIAALILDYARGFLDPSEWMRLCRADSMRRVLLRMGSQSSRSGHCWIRPWVWFGPDCDERWVQKEIRLAISGST